MSVFNYEQDADGIVTVTMDMNGPVNAMNEEYRTAMAETVDKLEHQEGLTGVVFASAKKVFFAGGDLRELLLVEKGHEAAFMDMLTSVKGVLRRLEKLPVPVVAAINGAALGGGYEICLCCNHRIAWDDKSVQIGLPEVGLGLLPGGGGIVRMVNMLGLAAALPYLLEGKKVVPAKALAEGMIHETVENIADLVPRAKAWILENKDNEEAAVQPWDRKGHRIPGGSANSPKLAQVIMGAPIMLLQKTRGLLPAPEKILDCAVEAARLDLDTALRVESRGLAYLVVTPEAKNQISTFFFAMNKINGGASRPQGIEPTSVKKVGILGAGMMGQGIAYVSAMAGIEVVLKDISLEAAQKGKAYTEALLDKRVSRGRMTEEKKSSILGLIQPTEKDTDLQGCDLIIEAVFENMELKNEITRSTETYLAENGVWGSNTSALPITRLETSDETLARAFDYSRQIKKTPIVINDSLGFFTSRTFGTYLDEGVRLLAEGINPVQIDHMGKALGMPVGPLAVYDEISQALTHKAQSTWKELGMLEEFGDDTTSFDVINTMVEQYGRGGRHHGGGFYEYAEDGSKSIWPKLLELYYKPEVQCDEDDMKDRLLFRQVIESLKCLESGVLRSVEDGNIGSIMGIGAPFWTGGYLQFVETYGYPRFVDRCNELVAKFGERCAPPQIALDKASGKAAA